MPKEPEIITKKGDSIKKTPSKKPPTRPVFEDDGSKAGNDGRAHDVSGFTDKKATVKEEIKVSKLDKSNPFLKNDAAEKPKRKAGKRVVRESPFKKTTTMTDQELKSPSKDSGFKRQLTTGNKN